MEILDSPKSGYQSLEEDALEKEFQFFLSQEVDGAQCLIIDEEESATKDRPTVLDPKTQDSSKESVQLGTALNMAFGLLPLRDSKPKHRGIEKKTSVVSPVRSSTISSQTAIGKEFKFLSPNLLESKGLFVNSQVEVAAFIGNNKIENSAFIGKMLPSTSNHYNIAPAPAAVNSLANISLQLTPSVFWHQPALNSYRVFFRQKYYLFRFEGNQVTNYLEEDYDGY
ncbi:hypothetical protein L9W76_17035 [Vibrio aestuarianus]|uniref:hypothetical protein n=1 Tax=Vibrio aestuarianus TaxID=28171 RepID=UPI00237C94AF|nr:hypothetical protein [Vibrio aestuarianus]MDE1254840.1 hypothetical protein [Vibrio aestuarianus]